MTRELGNIEKRVLLALGSIGDKATPEAIRAEGDFRELVEVMNGSSWLQAKGLVRHEETLRTYVSLGKEGEEYVDKGLPERRALGVLQEGGGRATLGDLAASGALTPQEVSLTIGWLKRKGFADITKEDGDTILTLKEPPEGPTADETVLAAIKDGEVDERDLDDEGVKLLSQRQGVIRKREEITRIIHLTDKGRRVLDEGLEVRDTITQLTPEHITSGAWKEAEIQPYDVTAFAPKAPVGKKHPLRQVIDHIRTIFLDMGFTEIEGPFVRSAFWNMDVLFTPQDHPAREMQDTFYLEEPARADLDDVLVGKVKAAHEDGGETGSSGWQYAWRRDVAEQLLLRTHTTVDTIQYLHEHPEPPVKIFSVDRVFRNETMDATHLPEFHQVEGVVMEEGANLSQLVGLLKEFYGKLGFPEVRVRPAYFPYTEPSLEVEVFYNDRWMELGGAGIFRPEVTRPVGVEHPVLAWGLGLERLAMMMLERTDLRELYVSDVAWLRDQPLL